ncbi:hypothetical protein Poli38472_003219 [Pythium oligandrum]|uniref:Transmembrane protein 43 n=1 Tax=Pythium oligandrum TaxID=41045 RepID=A0A8K1C648_PYTOL|nr:hypothetical protein Poli38472_003219 [Pythium oligandrum]|eukprot:TMW57294.1 hypothetical protein Poli38472_003219 [Pythium oligandrum]
MTRTTDHLIGGFLLLSSLLATSVNEQRLIRSTQSLEEGLRVVVSLATPAVQPENEGKLVHFSGLITTDPRLLHADTTLTRTPFALDPVFGIAARGVRLYRTVEMLQWVETAHTSTTGATDDDGDGGVDEHRERTYLYDLRWRSDRVDSSRFNDLSYQNPSDDAWKYESQVVQAKGVVVGEFKLNDDLIKQIERRDPVHLDKDNQKVMRNVLGRRLGEDWASKSALKHVSLEGDYFYLYQDGGRPVLGDLRISFSVTPAYPVTISGQQRGDTVVPFKTRAGEELLLLRDGSQSVSELFNFKLSVKYRENRFYRLFTFVLGFIGCLVLHPTLVRQVGPWVGHTHKLLTASTLSLALTLSVAGANWLLFRPLWAIAMALGGAIPSILLVLRHQTRADTRKTQ